MKYLFSFLFYLTIMFTNSSCGYGQSSSESTDIQIKSMLNNFYTSYITEFSIGDYKKVPLIEKQFCTTTLVNRLDSLNQGGDPFIKGQDSDTSMLNSLSIIKDSTIASIYIVSFIEKYDNSKTTIHLKVISQIDGYKIDDVW